MNAKRRLGRLLCWLGLHRWRRVLVVYTDRFTLVRVTVDEGSWCPRCGERSGDWSE